MQASSTKRRGTIFSVLFIVFMAGLMVWLISRLEDPEAIMQSLRSADASYMLLALGCMALFWFIESLILKSVCHGMGERLSVGASFVVSMTGQLFNNITPFASGGQPAQVLEMARRGISYGSSSCIMIVKFIIYQLSMTLYGLSVSIWKAPFFSAHIPGFYLLIALGFLTNCAALSIMVVVGLFPKGARAAARWLIAAGAKLHLVRHPDRLNERVNSELDGFYNNFQLIKTDLRRAIVPLLLTIAQLTLYFIIPFLLFRAVGIAGSSFADIFSATVFVNMVTAFIPAPGASGGAEGSFYWFLSIFIQNGDLLLVITMLWRVITFYVPIIVSGIVYALNKLHHRRKSETPAAE